MGVRLRFWRDWGSRHSDQSILYEKSFSIKSRIYIV